MIRVITGLPGAGKSLLTARTAVDLLYRNRNWHQKTGIYRPIYSNLKFSDSLEAEFEPYIKYWSEAMDLVKIRDADVIWEEMGAYCDSTQWANMPLELKRWLQQHRHRGVEITGNVQEFSQIDISLRRITHEVLYLRKIIGSRDPSPTRPPVKYVWGVILVQSVSPDNYKEDKKVSLSTSPHEAYVEKSEAHKLNVTA